MNRTKLAAAAALILIGAWTVRTFGALDARAVDSGPYSALDDGERAARLRATELTLATGRVPERDRALGHPDGAPLAWPPLVHGALARAARLAGGARDARELGGVDEARLERLVEPLAPLAGLLATALAFACGASFARGGRRIVPACAAAAAYALAPAAVARESAGSLASQPWIAVFSFAQVAALGFRFRAAQRVDTILGAFLGGLAAGFALLAGAEAWPVPMAALAVSIAVALGKPREEARDAWRAALVFAAVALAVVALGEPGESLARAVPELSDATRARGVLAAPAPLIASIVASLAIAGAALGSLRRSPAHALAAGVAFLSLACALFDGRFLATWNVALALLAATAAADRTVLRDRPRWAVAGAAAVLLAFAAPYAVALEQGGDARAQRAAVARGLAWMRAGSASPGPFNHPGADLDWCVLAPAELGPLVAYHARRPVALAVLGEATAARETALAAILGSSDDGALARWLDRERVRFVVAVPQLARDARLGGAASIDPGSLAARLALGGAPGAEGCQGLVRAWASPEWFTPDAQAAVEGPGAGPAITIWRRTEEASGGEPRVEARPAR